MRLLFLCLLLFFLAIDGRGAEKVTTVTVDGRELTGVSSVTIGHDGVILIIFSGGGIHSAYDKLPPAFLASWGIEKAAVDAALAAEKEKVAKKAADDLERAIRAGQFREIDGVIYDLRKPQPALNYIRGARLLQRIGEDALVDSPRGQFSAGTIFVHDLPNLQIMADTDRFNFFAKLDGTVELRSPIGMRAVRAFNAGRGLRREEIPDEILKDGKPFVIMHQDPPLGASAIAGLPDSTALRGNGSGFFVTDDGYLVTNFHVVKGAKKLKVKTHEGVFEATVVKSDPLADLALLKVTGKFKALAIAAERQVQLGESVFTIGFPNIVLQGIEPKFTDGKISSLAGLQDDPRQYQISVPVQPGNSGGALVDSAGNVAGVVVARISDSAAMRSSGAIPQNVNYAIKASALRELLATVPELTGKLKKPVLSAKPDQAVAAAQSAAAMVLIY